VALSGLPDAVIRESRGRLLCALGETGLAPPPGRLTLNLVPAGRRKAGEMLDLPMALAAIAAMGHLQPREVAGVLPLGELGIDGSLHDVPGGLAAAAAGLKVGLGRVAAPPRTAREAALDPDVRAHAFRSLGEVVAWLSGARESEPLPPACEAAESAGALDRLRAVRGHALAKEALAAAAAGAHALLFLGPPGVGKSLLARALADLLPPLSADERLDVTRLASAAGRWARGLARERPFRAPHHTTSLVGLVGGGSPPVAGEITLAHRGVLFLDELTEFRRDVLECLRQPLEEGRVRIARAAHQVELPAAFRLVAAMNPCPCGYLGHPRLACACGPREVRRYRSRISGPFLDRIDLRVELSVPDLDDLLASPRPRAGARPRAADDDEAAALAARVGRARELAGSRGADVPNAGLDAGALDRVAPLTRPMRRLFEEAAGRRELSARALQSLRRVARTLADLDGTASVGLEHLARALALRHELL
jgi:magnesium chelatase family protein